MCPLNPLDNHQISTPFQRDAILVTVCPYKEQPDFSKAEENGPEYGWGNNRVRDRFLLEQYRDHDQNPNEPNDETDFWK
jgi:hypothetical protein